MVDRRSTLFQEMNSGPVKQVSTPRQQRGFSQRSPWEILKAPVPSGGGLIGSLGDIISRPFRAIAEGGAEGLQFIGEGLAGGASRTWQDLTNDPHLDKIGDFLVGPEEDKKKGDEESTGPSPADEFTIKEQQQKLQDQVASNFQALETLDDLAAQQLSPEAQAQVAQLRASTEQQLAATQVQLNQLTNQALQSNRMWEDLEGRMFPGREKDILPGATPEQLKILREELDMVKAGDPAGVSNRILDITDAIMNSNMSDAEKEKRLKFIADRATANTELQTAMNQLVDDRRSLDMMLEMPDAELLGVEGTFTNTRLNMDLQFDTFGRATVSIGEEIEAVLEQKFGTNIPPNILNALTGDPTDQSDGILDMIVLGQLEPGSDQLFNLINNSIANGDEGLTNSIMNAVDTGLQTAGIREEAWGTALDQTTLRPGSYGLVAALFQVALGLGLDPQTAAAVAEDRNLHYIIAGKSNGQAGWQGNNQFGIGALSPEAYERVYAPYDQIAGKMDEELAALILYMLEGGEPANTMRRFMQTGVWGN